MEQSAEKDGIAGSSDFIDLALNCEKNGHRKLANVR